jgi:hypothetical protein
MLKIISAPLARPQRGRAAQYQGAAARAIVGNPFSARRHRRYPPPRDTAASAASSAA